MTVLAFTIVLFIIAAVLYVLNRVLAPPRTVLVLANLFAALLVLFMILAVFHIMPLPVTLR